MFEFNSISNMGYQKVKVVRCVCHVAGISKRSKDKQKSLFPKKNLHVNIRDFRKQKI